MGHLVLLYTPTVSCTVPSPGTGCYRGANWRGRILERKEEKREEKKDNREGKEREERKGFCIFMRLSSSALTKVLSWSD